MIAGERIHQAAEECATLPKSAQDLKSRMYSVGLTKKSEKVNEAQWEISLKVSQREDQSRWTESYRDRGREQEEVGFERGEK